MAGTPTEGSVEKSQQSAHYCPTSGLRSTLMFRKKVPLWPARCCMWRRSEAPLGTRRSELVQHARIRPHEWERCPAALWGTTCHFSSLLITCYHLQDLPGSFSTSSDRKLSWILEFWQTGDTQLAKKRHAWQGGLSRVSLRWRLILISRFLNF